MVSHLEKLSSTIPDAAYMLENILQVELYYEDFDYYAEEEAPAYRVHFSSQCLMTNISVANFIETVTFKSTYFLAIRFRVFKNKVI